MSKIICYEQPTNEYIRVCLRLEQLFKQTDATLEANNAFGSWQCVAAIIAILNLLDRPDLKTKLQKELKRFQSLLESHQQSPHVDRAVLGKVLGQLESSTQFLQSQSGKIGQNLRDNEFINQIRQHICHPGGGSSFDTPGFHCWLEQASHERIHHLRDWLADLMPVRAFMQLMLRLSREASHTRNVTAHAGFHQEALNSAQPCQLIRVFLETDEAIYPQISVGKHRISLRFFHLNVTEHRQQITDDIPFQLACCYL